MNDVSSKIKIELTTLTYGGECIGYLPDGRAVFVPGVLPGEEAEVELAEEKNSYVRARLLRVLRSSPKRITPRCGHFGECGGCHYQHMSYADQLLTKQTVVRDQLHRITGIPDPVVEAVVPAQQIWQYRNTMQFHVKTEGRLGFRKHYSSQVVAIHECHLPLSPIREFWPRLDFKPSKPERRIEVRCGSNGELLIVMEGNNLLSHGFNPDISPSIVRMGSKSNHVLAGKESLMMDVLGLSFKVSAGSFFQVNTPVAEAMIRHLQNHLPLTKKTVLLDLYSGAGLFSRFFAGQVSRTIAIELSSSACSDYAVNLAEFDNVELYMGAVEQVLPYLHVQSGVMIVDPPRAGLKRQVLDALISMAPELIAYISCDPSTLARDLRYLLAAGYRLEQVTPFDMFPQTYHVETVVLMSRGEWQRSWEGLI